MKATRPTRRADPGASRLRVWTRKQGLLSRVAHDLCLEAQRFEALLCREGPSWSVEVEVSVESLRVLGQVQGGVILPLKAKDQREIEKNLRGAAVLEARRFPLVHFQGSGSAGGEAELEMRGSLTLKGVTRPLQLTMLVTEEDQTLRVEGEVSLRQSEYGIKPFTALLGAIKVQDLLRVSWSLRYPPC